MSKTIKKGGTYIMTYCKNCGAPMDDNAGFCNNCGMQVASSTWDGGVLDTVINSIVASLIISFTCGIATPWAICYIMKFVISHVIIDGHRLSFDGTGGQLFGNWIKWFFLTLITCGIYGFWVTPRLYKWIASHTHVQ